MKSQRQEDRRTAKTIHSIKSLSHDRTLDDWFSLFEVQLQRDRLAAHALARLVTLGCDPAVIIELLEAEARAGTNLRQGFKHSRQEWKRRTRLFVPALDTFASHMESYNKQWLHVLLHLIDADTQMFFFEAADGRRSSLPLAFAQVLPSFLRQYRSVVSHIFLSRDSSFNRMFVRSTGLSMLYWYVRGLARTPHYTELSDLLRAAYMCLGRSVECAPDALRKDIKRFERKDPATFKKVASLTSRFLKGKSGSNDYVLYIFENLIKRSRPHQ